MAKYVVHYEMRKGSTSAGYSHRVECETERTAIQSPKQKVEKTGRATTSTSNVWRSVDMKLPYFKLKEAFDEARDSFSTGSGSDKLSAVAKLVGKSAANVGMLAAEAGVEVVKRAPEMIGDMAKRNLDQHSHRMTDEQRERAQELAQKGADAREQRLEKEREKEREEKERREEEQRGK